MARSTTGRGIIAAVVIAVVLGLLIGVLVGQRVGAGIGVATALIGAVVVVLRRNRRDLRELEQGHVPRPVDRALGEPPPE